MSILGSIVSAILGRGRPQGAPPSTPAGSPSAGTSTASPGASPTAGQSTSSGNVDVEAVLSKMAAAKKEKLNWRTSIVDLMKVLDLDSSLAARKELAKELHYSGDTSDSAAMNMWLHKQVMAKVAENGGKVPEELKH
jgi:uncharacterized protein DUF3597